MNVPTFNATASPVHRIDVFMSHASEDLVAARRLTGAIEQAGWSVFLAARDLPGVIDEGAWSQRIDEALDASRMLVLLTSPEALDKRWVTYEWRSFHDEILSGQENSDRAGVLFQGGGGFVFILHHEARGENREASARYVHR